MTWCAALIGLCAPACVVTDPIEFEQEVDQPPVIVDDPLYPNGSIIKFERVLGEGAKEFMLHLQVRDENADQVLQVRTVITRGDQPQIVYTCDEEPLLTGSVLRSYNIVLGPGDFVDDTCHKIEVVVSGHFDACLRNATAEKRAFYQDDVVTGYEEDIARATYWVWETNGNKLLNDPMKAQSLAKSCKPSEYTVH